MHHNSASRIARHNRTHTHLQQKRVLQCPAHGLKAEGRHHGVQQVEGVSEGAAGAAAAAAAHMGHHPLKCLACLHHSQLAVQNQVEGVQPTWGVQSVCGMYGHGSIGMCMQRFPGVYKYVGLVAGVKGGGLHGRSVRPHGMCCEL